MLMMMEGGRNSKQLGQAGRLRLSRHIWKLTNVIWRQTWKCAQWRKVSWADCRVSAWTKSPSPSLLVLWAGVDQETQVSLSIGNKSSFEHSGHWIKLQERDMCAKWNKSTPLLVHMSNVLNSLSATFRYIFSSKTGLFHAPSTFMTILTKNNFFYHLWPIQWQQ